MRSIRPEHKSKKCAITRDLRIIRNSFENRPEALIRGYLMVLKRDSDDKYSSSYGPLKFRPLKLRLPKKQDRRKGAKKWTLVDSVF